VKVIRFDLRKATASKMHSTPGVIDIVADSEEAALKELIEWLPSLCDEDAVCDVTGEYADISTHNDCEDIEADIGVFELDKWANKSAAVVAAAGD
jgi:hypothetical protein